MAEPEMAAPKEERADETEATEPEAEKPKILGLVTVALVEGKGLVVKNHGVDAHTGWAMLKAALDRIEKAALNLGKPKA